MLVDEHTALGSQLARLRELTDGYRTPADGCASYRLLYDRLAALESDTHMHIHLENNVLFPAALVEAV
jgi:regulator of cell morphogenesis and NO signaling